MAPDADEIKDVLNAKENSADPGVPPPPPVRGKSLRKPGKPGDETDDDDDGEAYEVMEQPEPEIDTYRIPSDPPSYVNDRLCQVKPMAQSADNKDEDSDSGELYEPVEDPDGGEYCEPVKMKDDRGPVFRLPPKPAERPKPKPKPSYENSSLKQSTLTEDEKDLSKPANQDSPVLHAEKKVNLQEEQKVEKTVDSPASGEFNIAEKSMRDIEQVLRVLRLDKYIERFRSEMIDGEILAELNVEDLQSEFSFSKLEAMRLFKYIEKGHIPK